MQECICIDRPTYVHTCVLTNLCCETTEVLAVTFVRVFHINVVEYTMWWLVSTYLGATRLGCSPVC